MQRLSIYPWLLVVVWFFPTVNRVYESVSGGQQVFWLFLLQVSVGEELQFAVLLSCTGGSDIGNVLLPHLRLVQRVFSCSQGALNAFAYGLSPGVREAIIEEAATLMPCCCRRRLPTAAQQLVDGSFAHSDAGIATPLPPASSAASLNSAPISPSSAGAASFSVRGQGGKQGNQSRSLLSRFGGADEDDEEGEGILMTPLPPAPPVRLPGVAAETPPTPRFTV
jgi:hypothetical protein